MSKVLLACSTVVLLYCWVIGNILLYFMQVAMKEALQETSEFQLSVQTACYHNGIPGCINLALMMQATSRVAGHKAEGALDA